MVVSPTIMTVVAVLHSGILAMTIGAKILNQLAKLTE